jgi:hypothetical protein
MRKTIAVVLFLTLAGGYVLGAPQTFTGKITDTMCGSKHMMAGKTEAECARECVNAGSNWGLVVGDKVYRLEGDKNKIAAFAGKQAKVTGEAKGDTITVTSIGETK